MKGKGREFRLALSKTLPIFAGIVFIGFSYGIYMNRLGFSFLYPMLMAMFIFAGSMEFITASLLLQSFNPLNAFLLTLAVNARHIFYGISMLKHYKGMGTKKFFLIFAMCDESFIINFSNIPPQEIDRGWFMFFVNLQLYSCWSISAALGGLMASYITFDTSGIEFVMTALFVVIFIDQWNSIKDHRSSIIGIGVSVLSLSLFGSKFVIPAMVLILVSLTLYRNKLTDETEIKEEAFS